MRKKIILFGIWIIWTLLCIYGTYNNTVKSAQPKAVEGGYEITYGNTGNTYSYN